MQCTPPPRSPLLLTVCADLIECLRAVLQYNVIAKEVAAEVGGIVINDLWQYPLCDIVISFLMVDLTMDSYGRMVNVSLIS